MKHSLKIMWACNVLILFFLFGCKKMYVNREILVGKYCFTYRDNRDSLFVYSTGDYYHKFASKNGYKVFESKGTWQYDSIANEVVFKDFVFFNDGGADNPPGYWFSRVEIAEDGEVRLMYAPEHKTYYYKIR